MIKSRRTIISCAITGAVHTPTMSPGLPITPEEIAGQAIDAARAGAAILHLHARDPHTGRPTPDPDVFAKFLPVIHEQCDAIINITTGGSIAMDLDERLAAAKRFKPEVATMNMGSMNFVFAGLAGQFSDWKHDWEKNYLELSRTAIFANSFSQIEHTFAVLGEGCGTRFEFECYDIGHLYSLAHFADRGIAKPPFLIQGIFGILGGIGADPDNLAHMVSIADKLFGDDYHFSAFGAGRHQIPFALQSALAGGHVRVGLEDSLYISRGTLAASNAQQVEKIVRLLTELGLEVATPDEARGMLALKGASAAEMVA
jgi:uncharacterized protein (DUF849 family)